MSTKIEWTGETWNPTTGCDRISPGCSGCYALKMAKRLKGMGQAKYQNDGDPRTSGPGFGLTIHPDELDKPLRWREPRTVFVDSMSDLFHTDVPDEFIAQVFAVMAVTPRHTYQVLTKRPQRMAKLLADPDWCLMVDDAMLGDWAAAAPGDRHPEHWPHPLPNVWLGVSVENQRYADLRIPHLLATPAAVRFLSCEPLLGPVDLTTWFSCDHDCEHDSLTGSRCHECGAVLRFLPHPKQPGIAVLEMVPIDWVIVGGESGRGRESRPMHPEWARSLRDQCTAAGVPFFFKQWGDWAPGYGGGRAPMQMVDGAPMCRAGKKAAGRALDGRTWDEMPERVREVVG